MSFGTLFWKLIPVVISPSIVFKFCTLGFEFSLVVSNCQSMIWLTCGCGLCLVGGISAKQKPFLWARGTENWCFWSCCENIISGGHSAFPIAVKQYDGITESLKVKPASLVWLIHCPQKCHCKLRHNLFDTFLWWFTDGYILATYHLKHRHICYKMESFLSASVFRVSI